MQLTKHDIIEGIVKSREYITCYEVINETEFDEKTVSSILVKLKKEGKIHVGKYVFNLNGRVVRAFKSGKGVDATNKSLDKSYAIVVKKQGPAPFVPHPDWAAAWVPKRTGHELAAVNQDWLNYIVRYRR